MPLLSICECLDSRLCVCVITFQCFHSCWLFFYKQCISVGPVHCSRDPQTSLFSAIFSLKIGLMALFTQLNIILLQYFQFSVFSKINCIQTNPLYLYFLLFYKPLFLSYLTYVDNFKKIFIQYLWKYTNFKNKINYFITFP